MEDKGVICLRLRGEHARRGEAVVIDQRRVPAADPLDRVGRIGDNGVEGLLIAEAGVEERVPEGDVEVVVIDVVEKHIHPRQVVGRLIGLLTDVLLADDLVPK